MREQEIQKIIRSDTFKYFRSENFRASLDYMCIEENILHIAEKWPTFGAWQVLEMLRIQRKDESVELEAVINVIGNKLSYEEDLELRRKEFVAKLEARMEKKEALRKRDGTVGVVYDLKTERWKTRHYYKGVERSYSAVRKKHACDWYDMMEMRNIPPRFQVLNRYKESRNAGKSSEPKEAGGDDQGGDSVPDSV